MPYNKHLIKLLTKQSGSVWENLDLSRVHRPNVVRSVLTTSVKIHPYRPPAWLIRANCRHFCLYTTEWNLPCINWNKVIYYVKAGLLVKASGIPSGNKLIKTMRYPQIWYPHMVKICTSIRCCIIETSSYPPRKSSAIFGNVRLAIGTILEILRKSSESGRKSWENHQKRLNQYVYIIKRALF